MLTTLCVTGEEAPMSANDEAVPSADSAGSLSVDDSLETAEQRWGGGGHHHYGGGGWGK